MLWLKPVPKRRLLRLRNNSRMVRQMSMKKILQVSMIWAAFMLPGLLFSAPAAANQEKFFKRVKIRFETVAKAPVASAVSGKVSAIRYANPWLLIFVDYSPGIAGGKTVWYDNVSMAVQVLVPVNVKKKNPVYLVLSGETVFRFVMGDGRPRTAIMAVPPQLFERYFPKGRKITPGTIMAKVVFRNSQGAELAAAYYPVASEKTVETKFIEVSRNPSTIEVEDGILPRESTPWQFMEFDQSDLVLKTQKK